MTSSKMAAAHVQSLALNRHMYYSDSCRGKTNIISIAKGKVKCIR